MPAFFNETDQQSHSNKFVGSATLSHNARNHSWRDCSMRREIYHARRDRGTAEICQYTNDKGGLSEWTYNMYVEQQVNVDSDDVPLTYIAWLSYYVELRKPCMQPMST